MQPKPVQLAAIMALVVVTVAFSFGLGFFLRDRTMSTTVVQATATPTGTPSNTSGPNFAVLGEIYDVLQREFYDPARVDAQQSLNGAITGLLGTLNDPHSTYVDPVSFELGDDLSGSYEGIGASVDQRDNEIVITQAFPGSPAEQAGIKSGDAILAVDGESTDGWTVTKAVQRIRGQRGTEVRITVRHETGDTVEITVERGEILFDTVGGCPDAPASDDVITSQIVFECPLLDAEGKPVTDYAYIYISQYTENTPDELRKILEKMNEGSYKGLILDLRNNPGGYLQETVDSTDEFVNAGVILSEVDRDGPEKRFEGEDGGLATEIPMVVLMNKNSASGSEVMAGALQDAGRAKVIGERSFGKGTVNHFVRLSDGGALYVSIGRWFTPKGNQIEGVGIKPDIEVVPTDQDIEQERDVVLFRAIEYLRTGR